MRFIALLSFLFVSCTAFCQENPVSWNVSTQKVSTGEHKIRFAASIEKGWHLYDLGPYEGGPNPTAFSFETSIGSKAKGGVVMKTKPVKQFDPIFKMEIGYFANEAVFEQTFILDPGVTSATVNATVEWMACDDKSCMPPADLDFSVTISAPENTVGRTATGGISEGNASAGTVDTLNGASIDAQSGSAIVSANEGGSSSASAAITPTRAGRSLWRMVMEGILWGFAALLTPCVFPMVPLTVSFFMKKSDNPARSRRNASIFGLSIVALYTLPIAIIIAIARLAGGEAVTADMFNWLSTHWIPNVTFFFIFIFFAASFFGAFEITLPSKWLNKSDSRSDNGGLIGIFFMAVTLVLVSFSCTGPIVGIVLIKSTAGEIWTPVVTMLAFSIAFALPFTLLAFFPSWLKNLPKSGGWLNSVKVSLGFLELALGLKFLSIADQTYHWGLLDREVYLALWIVIFSMLGFYLLGKMRFKHDSEFQYIGIGRLGLSIGIFSFVLYMIPGMWGAPLKGISGYLPPIHTQDFVIGSVQPASIGGDDYFGVGDNTTFPARVKHGDFLSLPHGLQGFFDYQEAIAHARKVGKPLFVDYTGHGCVNCREMEARVWSDPQVLQLLRDQFVILALYSDDKKVLPQDQWITTEGGKVLKGLGKINSYFANRTFGVNYQPYYLILDGQGRQLVPGRGYDLSVDGFVSFLRAGIDAYKASGE